RLGVERVEMTRAAFHEEEDHRLRLGRELRSAGQTAAVRRAQVVLKKGREGEGAEAAAGFEEEFAAAGQAWDVRRGSHRGDLGGARRDTVDHTPDEAGGP